jgi:hypothetical protein
MTNNTLVGKWLLLNSEDYDRYCTGTVTDKLSDHVYLVRINAAKGPDFSRLFHLCDLSVEWVSVFDSREDLEGCLAWLNSSDDEKPRVVAIK